VSSQELKPVADPQDSAVTDPAALPLLVEAFGRTDPGLVRGNNEDQFAIAELSKMMRVNRQRSADRGMT
jgi:hypothetical protein